MRACPSKAVILEVDFKRVLARRERIGALPANALHIEEIIEEHRLSVQHVEPVAAEPAACVTIIPSPA
jgi:hypothetical protein